MNVVFDWQRRIKKQLKSSFYQRKIKSLYIFAMSKRLQQTYLKQSVFCLLRLPIILFHPLQSNTVNRTYKWFRSFFFKDWSPWAWSYFLSRNDIMDIIISKVKIPASLPFLGLIATWKLLVCPFRICKTLFCGADL